MGFDGAIGFAPNIPSLAATVAIIRSRMEIQQLDIVKEAIGELLKERNAANPNGTMSHGRGRVACRKARRCHAEARDAKCLLAARRDV